MSKPILANKTRDEADRKAKDKEMTIGQLIDALQNAGMDLDSEVRASMDDGAKDTCAIGEIAAGCVGMVFISIVARRAERGRMSGKYPPLT